MFQFGSQTESERYKWLVVQQRVVNLKESPAMMHLRCFHLTGESATVNPQEFSVYVCLCVSAVCFVCVSVLGLNVDQVSECLLVAMRSNTMLPSQWTEEGPAAVGERDKGLQIIESDQHAELEWNGANGQNRNDVTGQHPNCLSALLRFHFTQRSLFSPSKYSIWYSLYSVHNMKPSSGTVTPALHCIHNLILTWGSTLHCERIKHMLIRSFHLLAVKTLQDSSVSLDLYHSFFFFFYQSLLVPGYPCVNFPRYTLDVAF